MKKKLIAIVTSLAMVATMIPATAFAGTAGSKVASEPEISIPDVSFVQTLDGTTSGSDAMLGGYKTAAGESMNAQITGSQDSNGNWTISGTVPYVTGFTAFSSKPAQQSGHYVLIKVTPDPTKLAASGVTHWTFTNPSVNQPGKITWQAPIVKAQTSETLVLWLDGFEGTTALDKLSNLNLQVYYLTSDSAISATQTVMTQQELATQIETANNTTAGSVVASDPVSVKADTVKQETAEETATSVKNRKLDPFKRAVDLIPTPIDTYKEGTDTLIQNAYSEYKNVKLDPDSLAYVQSPNGKEYHDAYETFVYAVKAQWGARLAALNKAVSDVTPVVKGDKDRGDEIGTVKDLQAYVAKFGAGVNGSTGDDLLWDALTDTSYTPDVEKDMDTLEGDVLKVLDEDRIPVIGTAVTAAAEAVKAMPIVIAIADLPDVDGSNYDVVYDTIQGIKTNYGKLSAAEKARVGNYRILEKKETTAKAFKEEVDNTIALVNKIEPLLSNGGTTLTKNDIEAYTDAYNKAKKAYDALDKGQKAKVNQETDSYLIEAEDNIANYNKGLQKEIALEKAITELPSGENPEDALAIAKAKATYNTMDPGTVGILNKLEKGFQKNINGRLTNTMNVAAVTLLKKGLLDNNQISDTKIDAAVAPVQAMIAALPATITLDDADSIQEAREAYNAITTAFNGMDSVDPTGTAISNEIKLALTAGRKTLEAAEEQKDTLIRSNSTAVNNFISAVAKISGGLETAPTVAKLNAITENDAVGIEYRNYTKTARNTYDALTDTQKAIIEQDLITNAELAYKKLLVAEKNVLGALTLDEVANLIKAVPNAATLDVKDADAVAKVKAAQTAYEALNEGVQKQLVANNYITQTELDNYLQAVRKVVEAETKTAAAAVVELIKAMPALPNAFSNQQEITEAYTLLTKAEEGFNALTKAQQAAVTNASILTKYRTDFNRLMKTYAIDLYKKAAGIDATKDLTPEDIATIAELKAYIDGKYIETKDITGFDQKVYDALIALLDDNAALENAKIAAIPAQTYTGSALEPEVTVTDKSGKALAKGTDYDVIYSNNINAGVGVATIVAASGSGYTGVQTITFTIDKANIKTAAKAAKIANQIYNKKAKTPAVSVTAGSKKLVKDADYTVKYTNNTNIGKATVTITGTENYTGTITTTFIITPAKGKITSLKAGKKQITVSYEAQKASGKTGYYLVYSPAKGKAKTTTSTATKKTIKGLKSGTSYKVKVRAYKTIGGKKYYGKYSDVKKVKVK